MNDVDNGPLCQRGIVDLSRYYKELGIKNVRLHDVVWTYDNVLDINYVFPEWRADPDRPEIICAHHAQLMAWTIQAIKR